MIYTIYYISLTREKSKEKLFKDDAEDHGRNDLCKKRVIDNYI